VASFAGIQNTSMLHYPEVVIDPSLLFSGGTGLSTQSRQDSAVIFVSDMIKHNVIDHAYMGMITRE
jgi:hypothetical protein